MRARLFLVASFICLCAAPPATAQAIRARIPIPPRAAKLATNVRAPSSGSASVPLGTPSSAPLSLAPGSMPPHAPASGSLTSLPLAPTSSASTLLAGGSDSCATPDVIAGLGTFAVSTIGATTGAEGQNEPLCLIFGQAAIHRDVWFAWTAPASGNTVISLCGGTTPTFADTKLAVYAGGACPTSPALACNDDACLAQSQLRFFATSGQTYTIQLGHFSPNGTYSGTFTIDQPAPAPDDDCATPTIIAGTGAFAIDTSGATTTVVTPFSCPGLGNNTIDQDVWREWTAPASGIARLSFCGGIGGADSKVAVYAGGVGCPASVPLACNDDRCGRESIARWSVVAGQSYLLQLGSTPAGATYTGSFTLDVGTPVPNDDCAAPSSIPASGPFQIDLALATTGAQGQNEPRCAFFSSTTIDNDAWFCWTAPASGSFDVTSVGLTTVDTKIAVYDGCGCPAATAIACGDDACGTRQSTATFQAQAGSSYTIQVGTFPNANVGLATFDVVPTPPPPPACFFDDGFSENSIGLASGGRYCWLQRFGAPGVLTRVSNISGEIVIPPGGPVDALVWDDPNDDGDPIDCVLVAQVTGTVAGIPIQTFALPSPLELDGVFFVGLSVPHTFNQFPAPVDTSGCPPSYEIAWSFGSTSAPIDYTTLSNNNIPPTGLLQLGYPGFWVLRAGCVESSARTRCGNSDPLRVPCPCGNSGLHPLGGCASSASADGARLIASGIPSLDDAVLHATGMTGNVALFFRASPAPSSAGTVFGDGVTCASGTLVRLRSVAFAGGTTGVASFPASAPPLSARSGTFAGSGATMTYGVWYHDAASFCSSATFNATNTLDVTW